MEAYILSEIPRMTKSKMSFRVGMSGKRGGRCIFYLVIQLLLCCYSCVRGYGNGPGNEFDGEVVCI